MLGDESLGLVLVQLTLLQSLRLAVQLGYDLSHEGSASVSALLEKWMRVGDGGQRTVFCSIGDEHALPLYV